MDVPADQFSENVQNDSDAGPLLNSTEIRILGSLIEKQATNPETYPLTLNALVLACNQKTSREPVLNLTQGQVGQSLRALEGRGFTRLVKAAALIAGSIRSTRRWSWYLRKWCCWVCCSCGGRKPSTSC